MFNRWLVLLFALVFACQTLAAVFDEHGAHQENTSHLSFDDTHETHQQEPISSNTSDDTLQNQFDCHHCCHCHAPAGVYLACGNSESYARKNSSFALHANASFTSLALMPEHRPPIA